MEHGRHYFLHYGTTEYFLFRDCNNALQILETHTGFFNGSFTWDGRHNGSPVNPNDTYRYELILWNCETFRSYTGAVDVIQ